MGAFRSKTVASIVAWKFAALVLLPLMLSVTAGCPVGRDVTLLVYTETVENTVPDQVARITPCDSLEDTLLNLLSLPGFTPEAGLFLSLLQSHDVVAMGPSIESKWDIASLFRPPRIRT
tara:strand:- start:249 stop:605 length:357 start_codon:yes stop_codon:yes gene_type:complete